jgi:hypothetical protein
MGLRPSERLIGQLVIDHQRLRRRASHVRDLGR